MFREKLNKIFSSRVFYIIFALLVSVALWMYVEFTENRDQPVELTNIEVEFLNEEWLHDRGLFITTHDPQTVTLVFEAPRSVASQLLQRGAVKVEIDLANIGTTGQVWLRYEIVLPPGIDRNMISREIRSPESILLTVDRLTVRPVPVRAIYRGGTASEDLIAETPEFDPQTITVSGPEEVVSRVREAYVLFTRENLAATFTDDLEFRLLDENGNELDDELLDKISTDFDRIRVTIPIRQMKEVPLTIELRHGAGSSPQNVTVTIEPSSIRILGEPEALRDFNSITLRTIDTTNFSRTFATNFPIIVPNHLTNLSGETEAAVFVEVLGLSIHYFSITNLHVANVPPGFVGEVMTRNLDVRVRGTEENLALVEEESIRVVADMRDWDANPGYHFIPSMVYIDGVDADVGAVGDYRLTVRLFAEEP